MDANQFFTYFYGFGAVLAIGLLIFAFLVDKKK
jgi:hypothetical protein